MNTTPEPANQPMIPVAGRECGECAMCCKLGTIAEVGKPDGEWCRHCSSHRKCDIYDTRPEVCRSYFCYFMLGTLGEEWRPSTCKFMISPMQNGALYISVDASRPESWRKEPYFTNIRRWSAQHRVVVLVGLRAIAVYPDRIDELGLLDGEHFLHTQEEPTANGGTITRTVRLHKSVLQKTG